MNKWRSTSLIAALFPAVLAHCNPKTSAGLHVVQFTQKDIWIPFSGNFIKLQNHTALIKWQINTQFVYFDSFCPLPLHLPSFHFSIFAHIDRFIFCWPVVCVGSAFSPAAGCVVPIFATAPDCIFSCSLIKKAHFFLSQDTLERIVRSLSSTNLLRWPTGGSTYTPAWLFNNSTNCPQNFKNVHFSSKGCAQPRVRCNNYKVTTDVWAIFPPFIFNFTHFMHFQGQFLTLPLSCLYLLSSSLTLPVSYSPPVPY